MNYQRLIFFSIFFQENCVGYLKYKKGLSASVDLSTVFDFDSLSNDNFKFLTWNNQMECMLECVTLDENMITKLKNWTEQFQPDETLKMGLGSLVAPYNL